MNCFKKIKDILYKDVSSENELKEMTVLLRMLCILNAFFHLLYFIIFTAIEGFRIGIWGIIFCICMLLVLHITFRDRTRLSLFLYSFVLALSMTAYCFLFGVQIGFQYALFTLILLLYYKTDEAPGFKLSFSFCAGLWAIVLPFFSGTNDASILLTNSRNLCLLSVNSLHLFFTIVIISRFYCLKFSASEEKILQYAKKLERLATLDALTQLQNRRGMMHHLNKLVAAYPANMRPCCLALSDIDFFKKVNDTYGHDAGDYVLQRLAEILTGFMKDKGQVSRWGGEEFLFVFEGSNGDYIYEELNKLKHLIERSDFTYKENMFHITMTFGLEEYDSRLNIDKVIEKADAKLYLGKKQGRNCVIY